MNREPVALTSLGAATDLERRVSRMLVRVSWPGKAGEAAPVAPLTAEEQQRFERGRDVYRNFCQACHQADGRGQDKLAPTLIDSTLALAAPEVPVRVLLHGKEGAIGLMPPIGSTLNDDQIASVLTYVRREWGQAGSPVERRDRRARVRAPDGEPDPPVDRCRTAGARRSEAQRRDTASRFLIRGRRSQLMRRDATS